MDRRLALTAAIGALVAVLFVVVASADPTPLARRSPSLPFDIALPELETNPSDELPALEPGSTETEEPPEPSASLRVLTTVIQLAFVAALIALAAVAAHRAWQRRPRLRWRRRTPPPDFAVLPDIAETIVADAETQDSVLRSGQPRNAIVACWSRLEQTVASVGSSRHPADTPTEFTARVLARYVVDHDALDRLAALYREARFSTHPIDERDRTVAIDALARLHDDLRRHAPAIHDTSAATR